MTTLRVTAIAVMLLLAGPVRAFPQPAQKPADAKGKPAGVIRGRITAADTGRPLRRAQVTVSASDSGERRTAATNSRGEYEVRELPVGRYTLFASRGGYQGLSYGSRLPGEPGSVVSLDEEETRGDVDFALPRAAVISGRVVDETGDPLAGVNVWIMRREFFRGRRTLVPATSARSDDTGQYRAVGLVPGEYYILALLRETWTASEKGRKRVYGYAPTYAPSAASLGDALRVKLAPGKEAANVDVALVAAPAVAISGTARRSDGSPLVGTSVSLGQNVVGPQMMSFGGVTSAIVDAQGAWQMRNVPPGEYELSASADGGSGRENATVKVIVQDADVDGVVVTTQPAIAVNGEVVMANGAPVPDLPSGRLRVTIETIGPNQPPTQIGAADDNGFVKNDGRFTFKAVSGPAVVRVATLPRGWGVKSVEVDGQEIADGVVTLKAGQPLDGVRIVLGDRFPAVNGRVTDDHLAGTRANVVIFPADESRWVGIADNVRATSTAQDGAFRFFTVRPGDYLAVALDSVQSWQTADPEFLATLKDAATKLTVREGEDAQVTLRLNASSRR
jgi:hypothetical protein